MKEYDIVIIGGGPAGLTAGLYASRARLKCVLIERGLPGGQIANAERVENFPGFPEGISGLELGQLIHKQATGFGLEIMMAEVSGIRLEQERKIIGTSEGELVARAVIIATGSERQKLGVPGEGAFTGRGVSYCATCDGAFFSGRPVAVVGGGDTALNEALELARFASRVIVIHRRDQLRATRILQERAFAEPRLEFLWNTVVEAIEGDRVVKSLRLRNVVTGERSALEIAGIFVAAGLTHNSGFVKDVLSIDAAGHVATNERLETAIPGIFAAGDVRSGSAHQAITAAGDGATAAIHAGEYLAR